MRTFFQILTLLVVFVVQTPDIVAQKRNTKAAAKPKTTNTKTATPQKKTTTKNTTTNVNTLRSQRDALQKKIKQSEAQLSQTQKAVKKQLQDLAVINAQIDEHQRNIGNIQQTLDTVNTNIALLEADLAKLSAQLKERRQKYYRSVLYLYQNRDASNKLLFLLSATDFTQLGRRYRYMKEYSKYQRVQGELVKRKQTEVEVAKVKLSAERDRHTELLKREQTENQMLAQRKTEQQTAVSSLQKQQKSLQAALASDRKEVAALNSKIDYYVQLALEQERKRREEAERKARELAERKAREEKQKQEAAAAKSKNATANNKSTASTSKGTTSSKASAKSEPKAETPRYMPNDKEYQLTSNFAANKGRFPMPITGSYLISTHYGSYTMSGTSVRLDSRGINLTGQAGAQARCIFDGEVTAVFSVGGLKNVMVRHGSYISIYCNLRTVSVSQGQRVSARQSLGAVAPDVSGKPNLHFQLRKESATLNPEQWLAR
ncbi:MAG: peptidoglycan DD-metalloendopeptidase family protein [Prevotellaceae bacterium]|nr:peptidoglycan DD-metalloendopeptidase family protein [Prevotellaceae bacterium]